MRDFLVNDMTAQEKYVLYKKWKMIDNRSETFIKLNSAALLLCEWGMITDEECRYLREKIKVTPVKARKLEGKEVSE
jgi:hypothetical protein